jgi:Tfp pilus assembly protein PilF/2-polyprenyl-3-methyl-5-hydroxy-6-metoxy-1,4-benzoquinol methylase
MNRKSRRGAAKGAQSGIRSSLDPSASAFAQALRHYQLGEWLAARASCRTILAHDPNHVGSLHLLAVMAQQSGLFDEAAGHYRSLIGIQPDMALAHHGFGHVLAAAGRLEEAGVALERAIALKDAKPSALTFDAAETWLALGNIYGRLGRAEQAVERFERAIRLRPDFAQAHNDYGVMLLALGKPKEAAAQFERALMLAPELLADVSAVKSILFKLNPALEHAVARAESAWPRLLSADEMLGSDGIATFANDVLLRCVLESGPVRDLSLERVLTSLRSVLLKLATSLGDGDEPVLALYCSLARQCFINEYVYPQTAEEQQALKLLKRELAGAFEQNAAVSPFGLAAVASYAPLLSLFDSVAILRRTWPEPVARLITQQIREVQEERELRAGIPRLTPIEDGVSADVRQQYEENPYPRWVLPPSSRSPRHRELVTVDQHLQALFPWAKFRPLGERDKVDILVAGCGTGEHPIGVARSFKGARVLAVDLSLNSLCYAKRKTRELGLQDIEYGQADILHLGSLGRSFDVVDATGVLHHLADPAEGWRQLSKLVRPGGFMCIGLYSALARADIVAARRFIAEHGYLTSVEDIRRCRQEILSALPAITRYFDFFTTSECRDLLFHVQEHLLSIPEIKHFLGANDLHFIGFEVDGQTIDAYRARVPDDRSMVDLDRWHTFETERPLTFGAMYKLWCQNLAGP